jgi:P27 family predicted phage terminase small subunit
MKRAPKHLSKEARKEWSRIQQEYGIEDDYGIFLLTRAMECFDKICSYEKIIEDQGATLMNRFGEIRVHPLIASQRDMRSSMLQSLKMLCLDIEPLKKPGRPAERKY